ncbi:MAG TPA: gamma-glutamyl-gamma-aminobutyrate hydrolase family protein [Solirubrobacteraceae bacterium]
MTRPLIGVTVSEIRCKQAAQSVRHGEPTQTEMTLGLPYMRAIERAGGIPVAVPPLEGEGIADLLEHVSGVLLTGGPDLDPAFYGCDPHPELGPLDASVDAFEIAMCRHADGQGLPILGVCRGAQVLNVARGGTLHQHLPDLTGGDVEHRQPEPGDRTTHDVLVAPDSRLAQTTGGGPVAVNTFHHQAVERLGEGLRPVAWAPDGIIEAIEGEDGPFALGVQWHAETLIGEAEQLALFALLVDAARRCVRRDPDAHAL